MNEDRDACDISNEGTEIPFLGPVWNTTFTHEGMINVLITLIYQTKQNLHMKLVDGCLLHLTEEGKVVKFSIQRGVDTTECGNIDSLMSPHLSLEAVICAHIGHESSVESNELRAKEFRFC